MKNVDNKYKAIPFWSWNDELEIPELLKQIEWMNDNGIGGFFMHARGGLKTEYLGKKWFDCIEACEKKAKELGMYAYAYDENGWPSGFVGGKLLSDIENHDKYLTCKIGEYDSSAKVSYNLDGDKLVRTTSGNNVLNVYEYYAASTADICNPEVVDKFIAMTHEEYKKRDNFDLKGFFTDEPQYYRWGTSFTRVLPGFWKEMYDEDIYDKIGLLFVEKEGYEEFRYRYWKTLQQLMLNNFAKKIYDWCDENGYKLTGHYVEETSLGNQIMCCGGVMPFYEFEHIPGIDWLSRNIGTSLSPRQLGSAAAQLGKKQTITETYGCCGWDVSPKELKHIAEFLYVGGVNLMCHHLLPYSEHGQRKRDYPSHFSMVNPWVRNNFKEFNDYFSILGEALSKSEEICNVGVLNPIRSAYLTYKRFEPGFNCIDIDEGLTKVLTKLDDMQIQYHLIDETLLEKHGKVEGNKFVMGLGKYDYIILPKIRTMGKFTEELLRNYIKNGGKVLIDENKPTYLEGTPYDYPYLENNVSYEEIKSAQPYVTSGAKGIRFTLRKDEDGNKFIFAVNLLDEPVDISISSPEFASFKSYDILRDEYELIDTTLHFEPYQSYLLYFSNEKAEEKEALSSLRFENDYDIVKSVDNYLMLDKLSYSFDAKEWSKPLLYMGVQDVMLRSRYKGDLYLKYEFDVKEIGEDMVLLSENNNIISVSLNGKELKKTCHSKVENELFEYDISSEVKVGRNTAIIKVTYFQSDIVYYTLFDANDTESLKNCLAYDSDIEAIFIRGKFGVYGDFKEGKDKNILLGNNFYIGKQKKHINNLIEEGFPFFAGDISLSTKKKVDSTKKELVFDERFHLVEVEINGENAGKMMFSSKKDVSKYLKVGENDFVITLTVGNRNLLGPFHTPEQENLSIGPYTWERFGSWKDGECPDLRDDYSFVKTII